MANVFTLATSSQLLPAREQMALTLGVHIILACLGVAFPAYMLIANYLGIKRSDPVALELAQRWSKVAAVTFAVGAVTGTVLTFEFGLLWPAFMSRFGNVFGVPFAIEGIFFFIEAIFIAIYIFGWKRLSPWTHFWTGIPIFICGLGGAFSVVAANSWMNQPQGFTLVHGKVTNVDPLKAIFNPATSYEVPHMILAAYMLTGFLIASVYAVGMLRGRRDRHHRLGLLIPLTVALIATPVQFMVGDTAARAIAKDQPVKFAAMECVDKTHSDVTEYLGGRCTADGVKGGIGIPGLDSFLVGFSTDTKVTGLDSVPANDRPPANTMLHWAFDAMVGICTALLGLGAWFGFVWWRRRDIPQTKWFLRAVAVSGVATLVALECGWIVTEVGRQPWIVNGFMRTSQAITGASGVWITFSVVVVLYTALTVATVLILRTMARRWREHDADPDAEGPYGPAALPGRCPRGGGDVSTADAVAAVLWLGATFYAVFGGADFGAGFWGLVAGSDERADHVREMIRRAIGPVWEANHVWLIFVLVVLWTAFSTAFGAIMSTLFIPLSLAALGIVLRGSGFAFQHVAGKARNRKASERFFGLSSLLTPFFMGTAVGAIAAGRVPPGNAQGDPVTSWLNLVSITTGLLFVATSAYLAAVFLVHDSRRFGEPEMERYFRSRALGAALATGALAIAAILVYRADDRFIYDGLTSDAIPLVIASLVCGGAVIALLARNRPRGTRVLAVGAVVAMVWAWGVAQYPYLLPQTLTIKAGAGVGETLNTVLVVFVIAVVLVLPSLAWLYSLAQRSIVEEKGEEALG